MSASRRRPARSYTTPRASTIRAQRTSSRRRSPPPGACAPPPPAAAAGAPPPDANAAAIAWLEGELKPRFVPGAADLDALAQARASAVQSALLDGTGIDPARVFVIKAAPLATSAGPVRMQLALK
ncbi:MAG: hypothetical protein JSR54_11410 [Proteobacteria bacterium]|nr:hypothetical protein [Pseudomonadota bacterium]